MAAAAAATAAMSARRQIWVKTTKIVTARITRWVKTTKIVTARITRWVKTTKIVTARVTDKITYKKSYWEDTHTCDFRFQYAPTATVHMSIPGECPCVNRVPEHVSA